MQLRTPVFLALTSLLLAGCKQSVEDCMHEQQQLWKEKHAPGNQLEGSPEFWDALEECERDS